VEVEGEVRMDAGRGGSQGQSKHRVKREKASSGGKSENKAESAVVCLNGAEHQAAILVDIAKSSTHCQTVSIDHTKELVLRTRSFPRCIPCVVLTSFTSVVCVDWSSKLMIMAPGMYKN
jgi:hypothetical protein